MEKANYTGASRILWGRDRQGTYESSAVTVTVDQAGIEDRPVHIYVKEGLERARSLHLAYDEAVQLHSYLCDLLQFTKGSRQIE